MALCNNDRFLEEKRANYVINKSFKMRRENCASPVISIVIPAYNAAESLKRALMSISAWKGKDLEVIVVDDGSEDNTISVANSIALTDSRLTVIHQDNMGRSSARNTGISIAHGEWLMFVDADDYLLAGWDGVTKDALNQYGNSVDYLIFSMTRSDLEDSTVSISSVDGNHTSTKITASVLKDALIKGKSIGYDSIKSQGFEWNACWARLFRRRLVIEAAEGHGGLPFPPCLRFSEDRLFNLAVLDTMGDSEIALVDVPIYYWDLGLSSTVGNASPDDALSLNDFVVAVDEMRLEHEKANLVAQEAFFQFRRSASLSIFKLAKATRTWKNLLENSCILEAVPQMSRFAGKHVRLHRLSLVLLKKRYVLPGLFIQHVTQRIGGALRTARGWMKRRRSKLNTGAE
ncbi:glycosyltransferase family 2 protein [Collinsella ihumii]|uniref:Glycosyltransferase family 2 protein n=1 Tax=Collinsella ihumii TaxID=1720204 RepID=A0ABT7XHP1_9ACTN|nr:glycosyltransferase family 2 protein [Collinsella ihumii]MDN0064727.1 glycosyltransferase family 2 protein [Collinsella ihumii]